MIQAYKSLEVVVAFLWSLVVRTLDQGIEGKKRAERRVHQGKIQYYKEKPYCESVYVDFENSI